MAWNFSIGVFVLFVECEWKKETKRYILLRRISVTIVDHCMIHERLTKGVEKGKK
jgi:hypothetical protein